MPRGPRFSLLLALPFVGLLVSTAPTHGAPAPAADSTAAVRLTAELLAPVAVASHARDSLSDLADRATGSERDVLEEQLWQRHLEVQTGLVAAATRLDALKRQGVIAPPARRMLDAALQTGWPRYVAQLERRTLRFQAMSEEIDSASGGQRLANEAQITTFIERTARMYQDVVDAMLTLERLGVDVARQRAWVTERLTVAAGQTGARLTVLGRQVALATARVQRAPDDAAARVELDALDLGMNRSVATYEAEIALLSRLGRDVTPLQVKLVLVTGKLTSAALQPRVLAGLLRYAQQHLFETLAVRLPRWLFQGLLLLVIFVAFRLLANAMKRAVRKVVQKADLSQLMRDTLASWSSRLVMVVGLLVLLRQVGFQVGPMLAGFGIAGVVLGFALQDTLSNFASGAMILAYQPFDVGDTIEAGGVLGNVRKMSLVSTTILTFDNQTVIVPNRKLWGDVIRNLTAQGTRRVDLTFAVGYGSDVEQVERVLGEIVQRDPRVLAEPAPLVKLHQLADSSMNFAVRVWVRQEHYWDVYWDTTRAVKLAFDRERIEIPFPQRELHVNLPGGDPAAVTRSAGPA
jgi:small conductance mechanosensitive channel